MVKKTYDTEKGIKKLEEWIVKGQIHRIRQPARIAYNDNGKLALIQYFVRNKLHNMDGPSGIRYIDNVVVELYWSINGKESLDHPDHYPLTKEEQIEYKLKN